jgi:glycyl-tRNA synthetase (class II)
VYERRELAHYALATTDLEFKFPFGWDELWGVANRGSYDLQAHSTAAGIDLTYTEPGTSKVPQRLCAACKLSCWCWGCPTECAWILEG